MPSCNSLGLLKPHARATRTKIGRSAWVVRAVLDRRAPIAVIPRPIDHQHQGIGDTNVHMQIPLIQDMLPVVQQTGCELRKVEGA